jgi:hypothetical protein
MAEVTKTETKKVDRTAEQAKLIARMKTLPESFAALPTSVVCEPLLTHIWVRPCPFCSGELAQPLSTVMRCGRSHGVTYKELAKVLAVYFGELNA